MEATDLAPLLHFTVRTLAREGKQSAYSYSKPGKSLTFSNAVLPILIPAGPEDNFLQRASVRYFRKCLKYVYSPAHPYKALRLLIRPHQQGLQSPAQSDPCPLLQSPCVWQINSSNRLSLGGLYVSSQQHGAEVTLSRSPGPGFGGQQLLLPTSWNTHSLGCILSNLADMLSQVQVTWRGQVYSHQSTTPVELPGDSQYYLLASHE